ncbi:MAG TPA: hypothetical protein VHK86_00855 [Nitrososphaera sp.]|nr:hypothetical protein [Nitrososphaera sp.]
MQEQSTAIEQPASKIKKVCLNDGGAYDHDLKVCPFCNWKLVEVDKDTWLETPDHDTILVCPKDTMAYNDLGMKNCRFCNAILVTFDEFNASELLEPEGNPAPAASENAKDATPLITKNKGTKVARVSNWLKKIPSYGKLVKR